MRRSTSIITNEPPYTAPGTHPAFRGKAITDAPLDRDAYHEVDPVELHLEDLVDRLGREEPDAIDLAAAGHRRLEARSERALPWPLAAPMSARRQPSVQVVSAVMAGLVIVLNATLLRVELHRPGRTAAALAAAPRWRRDGTPRAAGRCGSRRPAAPQCARQRTHPGAGR